MYKFNNVSNKDLSKLIDEWIKNERDRKIMKRRLLDGVKFEPLAEEFDISVWWAKTIVRRNETVILTNLPPKYRNGSR